MKEEIKPCPFCGGEAENHEEDNPQAYFVFCRSCGVSTDLSGEPEQATKEWNTRPSPWIKITPETMPEDRVEYFVMLSSGYAGKDTFIAEKQRWNSLRKNVTHYMPIPPIPEKG